jgi:hypothetical protein
MLEFSTHCWAINGRKLVGQGFGCISVAFLSVQFCFAQARPLISIGQTIDGSESKVKVAGRVHQVIPGKQYVFEAEIEGPGSYDGYCLLNVVDGRSQIILQTEQPSPDGNGIFSGFEGTGIVGNERGWIAFPGQFSRTKHPDEAYGLCLFNGTKRQILRPMESELRQARPIAISQNNQLLVSSHSGLYRLDLNSTNFQEAPFEPVVDSSGTQFDQHWGLQWFVPPNVGSRVAFGSGGRGDNQGGLFIVDVDSAEVNGVIRLGDQIPGGDATVVSLASTTDSVSPKINRAGQSLCVTYMKNTDGGNSTCAMLYDGNSLIELLRTGTEIGQDRAIIDEIKMTSLAENGLSAFYLALRTKSPPFSAETIAVWQDGRLFEVLRRTDKLNIQGIAARKDGVRILGSKLQSQGIFDLSLKGTVTPILITGQKLPFGQITEMVTPPSLDVLAWEPLVVLTSWTGKNQPGYLLLSDRKDSTATAQKARTWRDASGKHKIVATFESMQGNDVVLRKADQTDVRVPLERLSDADRKFVRRTISTSPTQD